MSKQYTLTLDDDTARQTGEIVETVGGTIPGFAAQILRDLSKLPLEEIARFRRDMRERAKDYETARVVAAGR